VTSQAVSVVDHVTAQDHQLFLVIRERA